MRSAHVLAALAGTVLALAAAPLYAQEKGEPPAGAEKASEKKDKPDFPTWKETSEGFEQVRTYADGDTFYNVWVRQKDGQMLAELPRGWQSQKHFFAMTVPTGESFAGLHAGDRYVYWKRIDKRMALVEPQLDVRATGDQETKDAIGKTFVDRVLVDVPIVCMGPNGQPVIDMDELLIGNMGTFYGPMGNGANKRLATIKAAKAFPENIELTFEVPVAGGAIKNFHYSISRIPDSTGYKPRKADERVGYFTVSYRDLSKYKADEVWNRYITRWNLEKRDPSLKLSPAKKPIIYYVENTVPPRYRRWIKEGVLYWNKAFEKVGILDAIEVYYQDKETGAHMDKDPEDVRYNFIRWDANDVGTAIGPSRKHPLTGEILDADVILTDGWIRHFWYQSNEFIPPTTAMEGMSAETIAWLDRHPTWDPRVRLASPEQRERMINQRAMGGTGLGVLAYGGQGLPAGGAAATPDEELARMGISPDARLCMAAQGKSNDMAVLGLQLECLGILDADEPKAQDGEKGDKKDEKKDGDKKDGEKPKVDKADLIDGIPEWFLGPMLADLTAHEVGHTLGLRHNFKASSIYSMAQINSEEIKGKKPFAGSVMDYIPVNIRMDGDGAIQGDYAMIAVGPYDQWAIEYGYGSTDSKEVLKRVSEPELVYATDEDTGGPDPLARRYDFAADPRDYAISRMKLAKFQRGRILDKFVKDGDSWAKSRRGYQITLASQTDAINIMASWLGGAFVNRDKKGDPGNRTPINPVPAAQQRAALKFVIENSFYDDSFALNSDLLQKMTVDKWSDGGNGNPGTEPTWPVHDRIMGIQSSALTMLMNPTTLRRVYDNEFLIPKGEDALTLPELLDTVSGAIWSELDSAPDKRYTPRDPMVSSLRRNLQREHMERLIDLSLGDGAGAAGRPIANLSTMKLREIQAKIGKMVEKSGSKLDAYTLAHLTESKMRIDKALEAQYIYNGTGGGGMGGFGFFFGQPTGQAAPQQPGKAPEEHR